VDAAIRGADKHKPAPAGTTGTVLQAAFAPNRAASLIFGGGLVLVLFVECAYVAQLRPAQAESRKKELGVRMALDRYRGPNENFVLGTTHQAATLMPTAATSWSNAVTTERYNLSS